VCLVVDASTLIAEVLRARGRKLLAHPALDLFVAADAWKETEHALPQRVSLLAERGYLDSASATQLLETALAALAARVVLVPSEVFSDLNSPARSSSPCPQYTGIPWAPTTRGST
jgi:hypothetical protein